MPDVSEKNSSTTHLPLAPSRHHPISQPLLEPLSNREIEIQELVSQRLRGKEIAAKLFISYQTVKKHLHNIYWKLNASGRRKAVEKAETLGILRRDNG